MPEKNIRPLFTCYGGNLDPDKPKRPQPQEEPLLKDPSVNPAGFKMSDVVGIGSKRGIVYQKIHGKVYVYGYERHVGGKESQEAEPIHILTWFPDEIPLDTEVFNETINLSELVEYSIGTVDGKLVIAATTIRQPVKNSSLSTPVYEVLRRTPIGWMSESELRQRERDWETGMNYNGVYEET